MAQRLVELIVPADQADQVREVIAEAQVGGPWHERLEDGQMLCRLLLEAEQTGPVVDRLEERFGKETGFQLIIMPVHAALPRPAEEEGNGPDADEATTDADNSGGERVKIPSGISREELYASVSDMARLSQVFVAMVVLSSIVAAVGVITDNVAVIIGAMVIAPLLGPNVALAFAATLGDLTLLQKAVRTNLVGVAIALAFSIALGLIVPVDPAIGEVARRTAVGWSDLAIALAAGAAGTLALTSGISAVLVGVMVAVALLPPTVVVGLMIGAGQWELAAGAGLLLVTNLICVNLAGVATFLVQGVRPLTWWEADRARRISLRALGIWLGLLVVLVVVIALSQRG